MAWQSNKKINGLYVYGPQNRNAWAHIQGMGWRPIWNQHDCQYEAMVAMASHAINENSSVKFFEDNKKIKILYVF